MKSKNIETVGILCMHTQDISKYDFLNNERGSVTLAVFVAMMFFSLFGAILYGTATRKYKIQSNNIETIKRAYTYAMTDDELYRLYDNMGAQKIKYERDGSNIRRIEIALEATGGISEINKLFFNIGEYFGELPTPIKENYRFLGWYTAEVGGTLITSTTIVTENIEAIYAHWEENEEPISSDIYALIYDDGTLSFNRTGEAKSGKTIKVSYDLLTNQTVQPWSSYASEITTVDFEEAIKPTSTRAWFKNCTNLVEIKNIENLDTKEVTTMQEMFRNCSSLASLDLSDFDTSSVTDMYYMFMECKKLSNLDVSSFDTSNVTTMRNMFGSCTSLSNLNVSNFDTSNVTDMRAMFYNCSNLLNLDVNNFKTSKVTDMQSMFYDCKKLSSLDISNFDTSNVLTMKQLFKNCSKLSDLNVSNFDTSKVTDMSSMFENCSNLTTIYVSDKWNNNSVTNSSNMFSSATKLIGGNGTTYNSLYKDATYARIDTLETPGYFTLKQ